MEDNLISKYVRNLMGFPENWRVYKIEAIADFKKVRLTGSLVRPVDEKYEPHLKRDYDWIKPEIGKHQMTISNEEYTEIYRIPTIDNGIA